jgi:hypothetical protein
MKKNYLFITIIIAMTISACTKSDVASPEVTITLVNECRAQIKIYDITDSRQYLNEIYDCSYISTLRIKLNQGRYKLVAETYQGRSIKKEFTKSYLAMNMTIEFP